MDKIKIRFDPTDNTLIAWFDEPQNMAYLSPIEEEAPGDLHLIKNEAGQFYHIAPGSLIIEMETASMLAERATEA